MGTMLMEQGMKLGEHPEVLNLTAPQVVESVHRAYLEQGSKAVYTNTFGASRRKLEGTGYTVEEIIDAGVQIARRAAQPYNAFVGLDMGPLGELMEPMGTLKWEEAYELFRQQVIQGVKSGVDFCVIETMTDLYEVKAAILVVKENSNLPILCSMTFEDNHRTFTGCDVKSFAVTAQGLGADALGINCSLGPREIYPIARELAQWTTLPIFVKPNAGLPVVEDGVTRYQMTADTFSQDMEPFFDLGVFAVGGCCGTNPQFIGQLAQKAGGICRQRELPVIPPAVCTPSRLVVLDRVRVIGERINPTGKKRLKQALLEGNMDYLVGQGIEQTEAGADILDVNVGLPELDQPAIMVRAIKTLQGVLDAPLQIDSSDPQVIEAALRAYNGKPIVNSVNGEDQVLDSILPLVKKYGAAVVGLTLDQKGIPATAQQRLEIAQKIVKRAMEYGIPKEDVYIDCLTLTVSAQQENAIQTLKAVEMVHKQLGVKTVLGVSNISFGLPARETMNLMFLSQALTCGLDLPIINPNATPMMDAIAAYHALSGADEACKEYIDRFAQRQMPVAGVASPGENQREIGYLIAKGLGEETKEACKQLLSAHSELEIVNGYLIPALDAIGRQYEEGKIFLPQLIQSAEAAKGAFEVIKTALAQKPGQQVNRGKILVATVKGDIHDIGKNIVKVILENYGYQVTDLGRDVPAEEIVTTAREQNVSLVGLSALMTTTVKSMEQTIQAIREAGLPCKIMVGGAVLTKEYASQIGADFYAQDAQQSVNIAREVFGQ